MDKTLTVEPAEPAVTATKRTDVAATPIWEEIIERMQSLPPESIADLPVDGAEQHDHYLYGTPKREES